MAELDPQPVEPIEPVESIETVVPVEAVEPAVPVVVEEPVAVPVVDETPTVIVHRRPQNVYSGMWGPVEIGILAISALTLLLSFLVYFFMVVPSNRELAHNKSESDRLSAELMSANTKYGEIHDTESQVGKILGSVDDFEVGFLPTIANGQSALYQRLNGLIHGYGLVNTTGPDYAPLETLDNNANQAEDEKGRSKFRSLYPGVYVTMTVEGSYQNLRRFIRDIETGREFVVISAVELAPSDNTQQPGSESKPAPINPNKIQVGPNGKLMQAPPNGAAPGQPLAQPQTNPNKGKAHGEYLALHLEMAAYFRRPGSTLMSGSVEQ